jgi:hypothetical protein
MTPVTIGLGLLVVLVAVLGLAARLRVAAARRSGLLPAAGQSTMSDVERLVSMGLGYPVLSRNSFLRIGGGQACG